MMECDKSRVRIETESGSVADMCLSDEAMNDPEAMGAIQTLIDAAYAQMKHAEYTPDNEGE